MELKVNIDKIKKSSFRFYFGILMFLFSIIAVIYSILRPDWFYLFYGIFFGFMSLSHIYEGRGKSLNSLFGKRFIAIDEEKIIIKSYTLKEAQIIEWQGIKSIKYGVAKIEINEKPDKTIFIDYSDLSYNLVQKIKETILRIAENKRITIT